MDKSRVAIMVSGRVQGVGFRYFTQDIADTLGITGWVRNCADGSVEMEAQGTEKDLEIFRDQIKEGPTLSHVSKVTSSQCSIVKNESTFEIRH